MKRIRRSKNKKVRNATVLKYRGITFQSKLELYCYKKLKEANLKFKYEGKRFELMSPFQFENDSYEMYKRKGEKIFGPQRKLVRGITYLPDFVGSGWIIETKGNPNDAFPLRWKLFKKYIVESSLDVDLYMPRNQKQVDKAIEIIKEKHERLLQRKKSK